MNEKIKKILIVTPYFPPKGGGLERYAFEIANLLKKKFGWKIVFISSGEMNGKKERIEQNGFVIYRLGFEFKLSNAPFSLKWFIQIKEIINEEKPSIINIHTPVPGIGDITALVSGKIPIVVTYHAGTMKKGKILVDSVISIYEKFALPFLLRKAKKIVSSSDFIRADFLKDYSAKCVTISPGTNTQTFTPKRNLSPITRTILFVGGLGKSEQHKGLHLILNVVEKVNRATMPVNLIVVGDGDMKKVYEEKVSKSNVSDKVVFTGKLSGTKLAEAYQKVNLLVLASLNDNFPTVIVEAMSSGLPVIASDVGAVSQLVENGRTGFLFKAGDENELFLKIRQLLVHPELMRQFGLAGRKKAVEHLDWNIRAKKYDQILSQTLEKRASITHISAYYPPHVGGLERVAQTTAELAAKAGYDVKVLASDQGSRGDTSPEPDNLTIKRMRSLELAHTPFAPGLIWNLLQLPKDTLIHFHLSQAYFPELVMLISKIRNIPYIVHFHLDVEASGKLGMLFVLYKKMVWGSFLKNARKIIVCSPDQISLLMKKYHIDPQNIVSIPNAVGKEFYAKRAYQMPTSKFRLLYVGRLAAQKRVERLIETMALLTIPAHLTIVGGGDEEKKLKDLTNKLNLTNISFEGVKNASQIQEFHRKNDALLISSDQEGLSLVVLEAMAGGLPVIGSNVEGIKVLLDKVGVLIDEPYVQHFAAAIEAIWRKPQQLQILSRRSIKKANNYTWERFMNQLQNVYLQTAK